MDKITGLSLNHVLVQKSRWLFSMQSKFGMDKIDSDSDSDYLFNINMYNIIFNSIHTFISDIKSPYTIKYTYN